MSTIYTSTRLSGNGNHGWRLDFLVSEQKMMSLVLAALRKKAIVLFGPQYDSLLFLQTLSNSLSCVCVCPLVVPSSCEDGWAQTEKGRLRAQSPRLYSLLFSSDGTAVPVRLRMSMLCTSLLLQILHWESCT